MICLSSGGSLALLEIIIQNNGDLSTEPKFGYVVKDFGSQKHSTRYDQKHIGCYPCLVLFPKNLGLSTDRPSII